MVMTTSDTEPAVDPDELLDLLDLDEDTGWIYDDEAYDWVDR
ncbi:hypothetical protein ABH925_003512 [Streptacidiphilus sp. EB129]